MQHLLALVVLSLTVAPWLPVAVAQSTPSSSAGESAQAEAERLLKAGDYSQSIDRALEAARHFEAAGNRKRLGVAFNTAGAAAIHRGDYQAAIAHLTRALALARETGDVDNEVLRLNNLGALEVSFGRYAEAYESYRAALDTLSRHQGTDWHAARRRLTQGNLAILYQYLGQNERALDIYRELRAAPSQVPPSIEAQLLTNLAVVYRRLGDPHKALETYRAARALLKRDPNAAASLYALHNIGVVEARDFEDYPAALKTFQEAFATARQSASRREEITERLYLGETYLLQRNWEKARAELAPALAAAAELKLSDERWTALYGLGRVAAAQGDTREALRLYEEAIAEIESARSRLGAASLKAEFLAGKRDVYDAAIALLLLSQAPQPDTARIFRHVEEGRARSLREALPGEQRENTAGLPGLQQRLAPGVMLLEWWAGADRLAVIWATATASGIAQGPLTRDDRAGLEKLAKALADPRSSQWAGLASQATRVLLPPGIPLDTASRLVIVADDGLPALPLEILGGGAGRRLVDRFDISYLPSAQLLRARPAATASSSGRGAPARRWPWQVTLAAFADPLVPAGSGALFDTSWARLAYSADEAKAVARALPGREQLHIGSDNRRNYLSYPDLARVPVLHFATHAELDPVDTRRSRMLFTPAPGNPASQYLFWGDIAKLKLDGVELVTLAACETAQGRYVRGEGVENFSRAFLGAGARATVSSLWRVSDRATAQLMQRFYEALARGETKAGALRQAKLSMARTAHPFYWAAFVLTGDGAETLTPIVPWTWILLPLAGLLMLSIAAAAVSLRRRTPPASQTSR